MKRTKLLSIFISVVMMLSVFAIVGSVQASAATLSKPSVTLSNASATSVKVSWGKVSNAKKYTVYRSTKKSSGFKAVKTTTSRSFTSTGLTCGKTYYFKVKAINGSKSSTSSVKSIKVKPVKVTSLKVEKGCTYLKLSWAKSSGASGYEIYSSTSKSGTYKKIASTSSTSYKNTGLKLGATRYYKVRAYKTVNSKKVYGNFSSVVSGKTLSAHEPSSSWVITKKETCATTGTKTNTCKYCKKTITQTIPKNDSHIWESKTVSSKVYCPHTRKTCTRCKKYYDINLKKHIYSTKKIAPTCTKKGYTVHTCTREECKYTYNDNYVPTVSHKYEKIKVSATCTEPPKTAWRCKMCKQYDPDRSEFVPIDGENPLGHTFNEYKVVENGYRQYFCSVCKVSGEIDRTCYIDLTNKTISVNSVASFGSSTTAPQGVKDKLDLTPDGVSNYEITGSATNITIDVNADRDVEIKLNGVTITNDTKDCFDIKNKSTAVDEATGEAIVPWVSISVKDGTVNTLKTVSGGNAIETSCKLELKGRGFLNMDTLATSISSKAKIEIKNLSLNIVSKNRGIDTKNDILNDAGLIKETLYSNIEIKPNAHITINSTDDGIRCKNMTITELGVGDVGTVIDITAGSDGIQLEGNTGITVNSGDLTINAGKYAFNCRADRIVFNPGVSSAKCKGAQGFAKP